ncbi:MAG: hypothetical protein ABJA74_11290 [Lapillicoccus sp.]
MWPAELPPGDGSTTALPLLIVQRLPADVREVELPDDVDVEVLAAGSGPAGSCCRPRARRRDQRWPAPRIPN